MAFFDEFVMIQKREIIPELDLRGTQISEAFKRRRPSAVINSVSQFFTDSTCLELQGLPRLPLLSSSQL